MDQWIIFLHTVNTQQVAYESYVVLYLVMSHYITSGYVWWNYIMKATLNERSDEETNKKQQGFYAGCTDKQNNIQAKKEV